MLEKHERVKAIENRKVEVYFQKKEEAKDLKVKNEGRKMQQKKFMKDCEKTNKKTKYYIKINEQRVIETRKLREEELKEAQRLKTQMKIEEEKNRIGKLEGEAQNLELIEQELLQKLQSTQMMEKDAFGELEKAMIASSENRRHKYEGK